MNGVTLGSRSTALLIAATTLGLAVTYLAVPADWLRAAILVTVGLATAAAILLATRRARPRDPLASWLLATSVALVTSGYAVALLGQPSPSVADVPRMLAYPAMAGAVITFQRHRISHDRASLLDALVVTVACAQAGWLALIEPVLRDDSASLAQLTVAGAYPLGGLLVLGVLARLLFSVIGSHDIAARLVIGGLGLGIGSEIAADLTDVPTVIVGWLPGAALLVLAALHPTMATPPSAVSTFHLVSAWRFVILLGLACLVSPVLVLSYQANDDATMATVVLGGALVLFSLALLHIVSLLGDLRHAFRREHVLRDATAALVSAADRGEVRDGALEAAVNLVGRPGSRAWRIDGDPGGTIAQATDDLDVATFLDAAELAALFPAAATGIDFGRYFFLLSRTSTWSVAGSVTSHESGSRPAVSGSSGQGRSVLTYR